MAAPVKLTEKLPKGEAYLETEAPAARWAFTSSADGGTIPLARAGPQQQLLQPVGDARTVPRLPDRRRAGDRRFAGRGDGRDRPVELVIAVAQRKSGQPIGQAAGLLSELSCGAQSETSVWKIERWGA